MKRILLSLVVAAMGWCMAMAVPAKPGLVLFVQSDGSTVSIQTVGDEFFSCHTTSDGLVVAQAPNGDWCYKTVAGITQIVAHDPAGRDSAENAFVEAERNELQPAMHVSETTRQIIKRVEALRKAAQVPPTGEVNIPILLVQYSDVKMSHTIDEFKARYVSDVKSVYQYFYAQSGGKFQPQFDVHGIYTLSQTRATYGAHGTNNAGSSVNDAGIGTMVAEAANLAKATGQVNWKKYDNDGDGYCDVLIVVYAGVGEAQASSAHPESIWPCQWDLYSAAYFGDGPGIQTMTDGTRIYKFAVFNEVNGSSDDGPLDGIGTFCHEFSHCIGLRDYYDTKYGGHYGMGNWSLMGHGSYADNGDTPVGYSAYDKNFLGWMDLISPVEDTKYTLNPLNDTSAGCGEAICLQSHLHENEFYVLENRKRQGWDQFLPADGLLIFHVNYDATTYSSNKVNCSDIQLMTIAPADNVLSTATETYDTWGKTKHEFDDNTTPAADLWMTSAGSITGSAGKLSQPLNNIQLNADGTVSLWYKSSVTPTAPAVETPTNVQKTRFAAKWTPQGDTEHATHYTLWLHRQEATKQLDVVSIGNVGSSVSGSTFYDISSQAASVLPQGWTMTPNVYFSSNYLMLHTGTMTSATYDLKGYDKVTITVQGRRYSSTYGNAQLIIASGKQSKTITFTSNTLTSKTIELEVDGEAGESITFSGSSLPCIKTITLKAGGSPLYAPAMKAPAETGDEVERTITGITNTEYLVKNLQANATYRYKVKTHYSNGCESGWSSISHITLNGEDETESNPGDVNGDGSVDVSDVTALIYYILTNDASGVVIDNVNVDGTGQVNVADVTALIYKILNNK